MFCDTFCGKDLNMPEQDFFGNQQDFDMTREYDERLRFFPRWETLPYKMSKRSYSLKDFYSGNQPPYILHCLTLESLSKSLTFDLPDQLSICLRSNL